MRNEEIISAALFQDADNFFHKGFKIFDVLKETLGMDFVNGMVREKGETVVHIRNNINLREIQLVNPDSAFRLLRAAAKLENDLFSAL